MKTHKIKFFHLNPALTELYPAVLGNDHTMDWIKDERKKWNSIDEKTRLGMKSILKCPGIFDMYSKGFFIQQPYEVLLTAKENKVYIKTPDLNSLYENTQKIVFHQPNDIAIMPFREGTLSCMPNIPTGFQLLSSIPLLILPVPYPDQYEWEGSMGILETHKSVEVNLQVHLNNYKGEKEKTWRINPGDNIMFVIPLTSDNWVIENQLTIKEKLWIEAHIIIKRKKNLCPYSTILPGMRKRLYDAFKKLWG